jgi:NTE family protein
MGHRELKAIKQVLPVTALLLVAGCASYGRVENQQKVEGVVVPGNYSLTNNVPTANENKVLLAFSGGGTRAAALAYGVLLELRDTTVTVQGQSRRTLDGVDTISSVSGGSFTAAYYGLYGERIFEKYEDEFLRKNIEGRLIRRMYLNPLSWFNRSGRTEEAIKYYQKNLFHGATFSDLQKQNGPLILINASDLGHGVRFSFVQEYFDLLNSDIGTFPVARAVTASSAVPILFDPIVVANYPGKKKEKTPEWLNRLQSAARFGDNTQLEMVTHGIKSYFDKTDHQYIHFVDGGITDNLGLRAVYDIVEMSGGVKAFYSKNNGRKIPRRLVLISVNASAKRQSSMDRSDRQPSIKETMGSVTGIQLLRYNLSTLNLLEHSVGEWSKELSTPDKPVTPYFIQVKFDDVPDEKEQAFLNTIPTSFNLTDEQVDALIKAGRELLRNNPTFQQLLSDIQE